MKALICQKPGELVYAVREKPIPQPNRSIIKIRRIGICGTDLHAYAGDQPFFNYPRILGHELSGELIETDSKSGFILGESVTFVPYYNCGHCFACRSEKPNCCINLNVCGVHSDGGMVEFLSVPTSALVNGRGLTLDELALVEPLAVSAHGIRRASIKKGEFVLVIGAGPIGMAAMEFARLAGGRVIAMDINSHRLKFCQDVLSIDHIINPTESNAEELLREITHLDMPPVVLDATGNLKAINDSFRFISHGGKYVLIGLQKEHISFSHPEFHKREATLMSSRNATMADFGFVIDCIKKKIINPSSYITHCTTFENAAKEFPSWLDPTSGVIKAMINLS